MKIKHNLVKSYNYNLTEFSKGDFFLPNNIKELKEILKKKNVLIKTGSCGHGDKSSLVGNCNIVSLNRFNKILNFNKKSSTIVVQTGISLLNLTKILKSKGYFIYNIPGGPGVSLGGAIAGNVHGRFSNEKFCSFGDNIISLKLIDKNLKIKNINKNNFLFNSLIGSLGNYGVLIEAKLKIHKIKNYFYLEKENFLDSEKKFLIFDNDKEKYFGYLNYFSKKFEFNVKTIEPIIDKKKDKNFEKIKKIFVPKKIWFFVNTYTLYILYYFLFKIKNNFFKEKKRVLSFEKMIYVSNYISKLPLFFRNGFIEIQFSVSKTKLLNLINQLKNLISKKKVNPVFFILKKLNSSSKKYVFNFPIFKHSISLGFSKKQFLENRLFFLKLYDLLYKNKCNIYVTKDELFTNFLFKKYKKKIKFKQHQSIYNTSNFLKKF